MGGQLPRQVGLPDCQRLHRNPIGLPAQRHGLIGNLEREFERLQFGCIRFMKAQLIVNSKLTAPRGLI